MGREKDGQTLRRQKREKAKAATFGWKIEVERISPALKTILSQRETASRIPRSDKKPWPDVISYIRSERNQSFYSASAPKTSRTKKILHQSDVRLSSIHQHQPWFTYIVFIPTSPIYSFPPVWSKTCDVSIKWVPVSMTLERCRERKIILLTVRSSSGPPGNWNREFLD